MAIPDNYNPWEHLQSVVRIAYNRRTRREFRDVTATDADLDLLIPRHSLRLACTHMDADTASMTLIRILLYHFIIAGDAGLIPEMYGIPVDTFQQQRKFRPQVTLHFAEDRQDVETGFAELRAQISFRLTNQTYENITPPIATSLANKIRTEFATGAGYRIHKGRIKATYRDPDRGYNMVLSVFSESEAREVINKVLDCQNHNPDWTKLTLSELSIPPPILPPNEFIYGRSRRPPRKRPVGWLRFTFAELHIWGVQSPITLVDRTGRRRDPLVTV